MVAGRMMSGSKYIKESHPVDVYVGHRLRMRRKLLGLSQDDLGKEVGVTFQQIQKYERGVNRMGASRMWEFAKALKIPEAYFFSMDMMPIKLAMICTQKKMKSFSLHIMQ